MGLGTNTAGFNERRAPFRGGHQLKNISVRTTKIGPRIRQEYTI